MICSRCGMPRRLVGPQLSLDGWGRACVRYACQACGYSWTEAMRAREVPAGRVVSIAAHPKYAARTSFRSKSSAGLPLATTFPLAST
jgi:hypothetical protein